MWLEPIEIVLRLYLPHDTYAAIAASIRLCVDFGDLVEA